MLKTLQNEAELSEQVKGLTKKQYIKKSTYLVSKANTIMFGFNWEETSIKDWAKRWDKLLKRCKECGLPLHKWRFLNWFGLSFTQWKKQLQGIHVVDWARKIAFVENKIQQLHIDLIDGIYNSDNENVQMKLVEKEEANLFESVDNNVSKPNINIITNTNFSTPDNVIIEKVIEGQETDGDN